MILFEDEHGLCCRPADLIASMVPAFPNRLRVVTAEGVVGYFYEFQDLTEPGLCQVSSSQWLNPIHMRRLEFQGDYLVITLDSQDEIRVTPKWAPAVRRFLGIDRYKPQPESLTRLFLREYPFEIARASADVLKKNFSSARRLIANIL